MAAANRLPNFALTADAGSSPALLARLKDTFAEAVPWPLDDKTTQTIFLGMGSRYCPVSRTASSGRLLTRNFAANIGPKLFHDESNRVVPNLRAPYACGIR